MKFRIAMKDPDALYEAINEAVTKDVVDNFKIDEDEQNAIIDMRKKKVGELCSKWFEYGEYLTVEIDTDAGTCTVVKV